MNKSKITVIFLTLIFFLGSIFCLSAQSEKELIAQLVSEDQDAINALVLYPEDTRLAILEASLFPEALIKLESIQSQTSSSFREIMDQHPRETQEMIWDLTRYPNLVHKLALTEPGSKKEIKKVLKEYPQVIHDRAEKSFLYHHKLLMEIDQLNSSAESAFNILLAEYPVKTQDALQELIALPEVLTILTDNIRLTVLAGDIYRKEPEWVLHKADSFHLEVARRNAEEIEDWKAGLENNPEAMEELQASAEAYEADYGYDDEYYDYSYDDLYYDGEVEEVVVRHYYHYHYPYWFGYPSWYYYPRWRLYPVWYDWGFYYGSYGTCMVVNLPSFYFMNWYFYHPNHHHHWPHLSAHFTNHYYGHRAIGVSSINTTVYHWQRRNREIVSEDWLRDDGQLTERFREYGKLETAREKYNRAHPQKSQTQKEYLDRNARRYPKMTEKASAKKQDRKTVEKARDKKTYKEPIPPTTRKKETTTDPRKKTVPKVKKQLPPDRTTPKVNKGKDHHKNTWEKSRKTRPEIKTSPKPKIKTKPRTKVKTKPRMKTRTSKTTAPKTRTKTTVKKKN